ncbi:MAG: family 20 glycosylhydrolase, partial [Oxalobacter sp.]
VNHTTYASDSVKAGIQAGNKAYYDFGTNELTETEMDEIFVAANKAGIGIIPLINTPGHMDAIVTAMTNLGISNPNYNGSKTTIDLDNSAAVNFTKELVKKYAAYFKGKGCSIFNMGCDEYANDIYTSGSMGFGNLVSSGKYGNFVTYVNDLAAIIKQVGMTPMAFNDGFYFNGNTSSGTFDTDIMISFWTSGWDGYQSETAAELSTRGHKMINTNGDYYYVLGKNDAFTPGNTTTHDASLYTAASTFSNTQFMGSTVSNPAGSMFCIWCDYPNAETETEIAANVRLTLRAMEARMDEETLNNLDTSTVVAGGFNADGSINSDTSGGGDDEETKYDDIIYLTVDGTDERTIEGVNYADECNVADSTIVTVVAIGNDATETTVTYTKVNSNPTWNTLISSNTTSATSYYYLANDGNYYQLYVTRSDSKYNYLYNYSLGYYANGSSILTSVASESNSRGYASVSGITLYTKSSTDGTPASTTVTFTGLKPGETTVQIGSVYYKVIVDYKIVDVSLVLDGTVTKTQTNEITDTPEIADSSIVDVTVNGKQVIFKAKAVGTTTVTVGDTKYNVTVSTEDLSDKSQTIEYWITNGRPTDANGSNEYSVQAAMVGVNSEKGVDVGSLLPENTTKETRTLQFWRCRLLDTALANSSTSGTEKQTEDSGDDETYNGVEFTKVRYWNGTWAVYTENNEWVTVTDEHQLVAYYLEILPVAYELTVTAADWGKKGDGSPSGDYLDPSSSCTVSIQVVYEDGTTNPAGTTADDLKSSTIAYGYWSSGRGIGTLNLIGLEGYQIWKVEAETGAMTYANSSTTWGSFTVNSFKWDGNAMTVYEGDPVDSYIIHNDSNNPSTDGYYANLMWDENYEAILITVYVKAAETEDSLTVHYVDQTENVEFYSYNITVASGTLFNENIGLADPWKGNLVNGSVKNTLDVTQTVSADLSTMPAIGAQYRYSEYTCVKVERSVEGKDVYLYYTFTNTHSFVIDFGLPLKITAADLGLENITNVTSTISGAQFGMAFTNDDEHYVLYTPNKVLKGVEILQLTLTENAVPVTHQIYIYPASNVLYEDTFLSEKDSSVENLKTWTHQGKASSLQQSSENKLYGYDEKYATSKGNSMGSCWTVSGLTSGNGTKFLTTSFYGNGFDLIGTAGPDTGMVYLVIQGQDEG